MVVVAAGDCQADCTESNSYCVNNGGRPLQSTLAKAKQVKKLVKVTVSRSIYRLLMFCSPLQLSCVQL